MDTKRQQAPPYYQICSKCNARMDIKPVSSMGRFRKVIEAHCSMCGNIEYPGFGNRKLLIIDVTNEELIVSQLNQLAKENDSDAETEALCTIEAFFATYGVRSSLDPMPKGE